MPLRCRVAAGTRLPLRNARGLSTAQATGRHSGAETGTERHKEGGVQQVRALLINGYCQTGRDRLAAHGCTDAAVLYDAMLRGLARGHGVELSTEAVYPVSDSFGLPSVEELSTFDAIAWTGSNLTIHSGAPEVNVQLELARLAYASGVPQFGSCWGMQIAAQSAGIATLANPAGREQGLARKVALTAAGRRHPLFRGAPSCFDGFTAHTDMVCPDAARTTNAGPVECTVLAGNAWTPVQALAVRYLGGEFWGVQYHPEFDLREAALLMNVASALLIKQGTFTAQADIDEHVKLMLELADDPTREDLRLRLGIDDDVLDADKRCAAPARWLTELVYPRASQRPRNCGATEHLAPYTAAPGVASTVSQYESSQSSAHKHTRCRAYSTQATQQATIPECDALGWTVTPAAPCLGAELAGPDLSRLLTGDELRAIRAALLRYEVIFFRGQASMQPADHLRLAAAFGEVQLHQAYPHVPGFPAITVLENDRDNPSLIEQWHTDMTFRPCPPLGSILHAIVVPAEPNEQGMQAGDTEFFSMAAAYEALDEGLKARLADLSAVHSFEKGFAESLAKPGGRERLKHMLDANPPVQHPVLRTHPESGKTSLFVNRLFTSHIIDIERAESDALLAQLYEHMEQPRFRCRFQWTEGAIAFWDNRITQHRPGE